MRTLLITVGALMALSTSAAFAAPSETGQQNRSCNAEINQLNKEFFGPPGKAAENFDPTGDTSTSEYNHIKNDFRKANKETYPTC